ncbi:MAG: carboxypeptidase regulatory-like domain-containing protein, partial [Acidobacteriia bacterium]|nr:carboxypeptidase regulatory-like domain-containing protein [Terriglobia bacterium]
MGVRFLPARALQSRDRQGAIVAARYLLATLLLCTMLHAQVTLPGRIVDETGAGVPGARVEFLSTESASPVVTSSDPAGNFTVALPQAGPYKIRAERQGFYVYQGQEQTFNEALTQITVTLNHVQEFSDRIDIQASPAGIDPQQPS